MEQICANLWCKQPFDILQADLDLYDLVSPTVGGRKFAIPPPTVCPDCRLHRSMCWRNERNFHRRSCDLCKRHIISVYDDKVVFPVYCSSCFFGDAWGPLATATEFSESVPLFDQLQALKIRAPHIALLSKNSENSEFTHHSSSNRNCYLSVVTFNSENVLYSKKVMKSKDVIDCLFLLQPCELAYECSGGGNLYNTTHLINCFTVSDSRFCIDCHQCSHCFLCWNLRSKEYCIRNVPYSREEYEQQIEVLLGSEQKLQELRREFELICRSKALYKPVEFVNCENCTGDYLSNCKDVHMSYSSAGGENVRYGWEFDPTALDMPLINCIDAYNFGPAELLCLVHAQTKGYANVVSNYSYDMKNSLFVDNCHNCENCCACVGLRNKKYCILNKQYSKEEYETLVPRIIDHAQKSGEWGQFFPIDHSPFAYNETLAHEYFPLSKEEVLRRGWQWRDQKDETPKVDRIIPASNLPDSIDDIPDDILSRAIECDITKRPFKIIKQELEFYRRMMLPIPRLHPDERHRRRMALRNPRKLWSRQCAKCGEGIETTFAPERTERVYCESCYLKEVY